MNSWGDRIDGATLALMDNRKVAPFSGRGPALVAIDLYDLVYDGGPRPVREWMEEYPSSLESMRGRLCLRPLNFMKRRGAHPFISCWSLAFVNRGEII